MSELRLPIAVLISGGGSTLRNLIAKSRADELPVDFRVVISSNPNALGLEYARQADIAAHVVDRKAYDSVGDFSQVVFDHCRRAGARLVVCGGFLKLLDIPADFEQRVINIHPALIPSFCGHGYYGAAVHRAVLDHGVKVSGCTVHIVDNQYDHGPIILQQTVPVLDDDTPESLAARVFAVECDALPEAIRLFAAGRLRVQGRRVRVSAASGSP